jgi:hypothetical protein
MDKLITFLVTNWDVVGLLLTNLVAIFIPSPAKRFKTKQLEEL